MTTSTQSAPPAAGQAAPEFTLATTAGGTVTLSSLRGHNVLLAFFPLAFTSTCTTEMCAFSEDFTAFEQHDVVILPISVDATASLKEYKAKYNLRTDFLSDFRRDVSRAYGVLNEEKYYAKRAYFLIDREGIVRWAHVEEHGGLRRENAEILAEIAKL